MSIIALPRGANLVADGAFERSDFGIWTLRVGPRITAKIDRRVRFSGGGSFRLTARAQRVTTSVVLAQQVAAWPDSAAGSRYVLRFRVRTVGLSRAIQTELKLNYAGGGYVFFRGGPEGAASVKQLGIPAGTSTRWTTMVVKATARFPLQSIDAFVLDSGVGPVVGTLWIDDVHLRSLP